LISFQEKRGFLYAYKERIRIQSSIVRSKKQIFAVPSLDAIMENFYVTIENEEDKVEELIVLSKSSADPKILERIEKHRDNFNFVKRSIIPLRDSLYAIKSLKEDKDFKVIEVEIFSYFSRLHQKFGTFRTDRL
jgi:magnesium transporter